MQEVKKIIGKCKMCGQCCKDIQMDINMDSGYPQQFLRHDFNYLLRYFMGGLLRNNPHLDFSKVYQFNIYEDGEGLRAHLQGVECKALEYDEKIKTYKCSIHEDKPSLCEQYPETDSRLKKCCGFKKITIKPKKTKKKVKKK